MSSLERRRELVTVSPSSEAPRSRAPRDAGLLRSRGCRLRETRGQRRAEDARRHGLTVGHAKTGSWMPLESVGGRARAALGIASRIFLAMSWSVTRARRWAPRRAGSRFLVPNSQAAMDRMFARTWRRAQVCHCERTPLVQRERAFDAKPASISGSRCRGRPRRRRGRRLGCRPAPCLLRWRRARPTRPSHLARRVR